MDLMTYCSKPHGIGKAMKSQEKKDRTHAWTSLAMSVFLHELPHGMGYISIECVCTKEKSSYFMSGNLTFLW